MSEYVTIAPELNLHGERTDKTIGAWFLGPKGENEALLLELVEKAVAEHAKARRGTHSDDPEWIDKKVKDSTQYKNATEQLKFYFTKLLEDLKQSVPFFSYRYQGHMLWDVTLPAVLGYFAAFLWNQNNVAAEASPYTTRLEMAVGDDLCKMLGYAVPPRLPLPEHPDDVGVNDDREEQLGPWGHITCGGSVANIESMWAARNLKFYPVALAAALRDDASSVSRARGLRVPLPNGHSAVLVELDLWSALNLKVDDILTLPGRLRKHYGVSPAELTAALNTQSLQSLGFLEFQRRHLGNLPSPVVIGSATMHYSWPKGAALLGLGASQVWRVAVDLNCRLDLVALRQALDRCLAERRPVIQVVSITGTTEQSAVDPLNDILQLREEYRRAGLEFFVHADAAWGGYFASLLRTPEKAGAWAPEAFIKPDVGLTRPYPVKYVMSEYVHQQLEALQRADSITIDPHKAGFVPYPAGALCYRDVRTRELVSLKAPVIFHGLADPTVGVFGIEGSKPGAAAAAVYLSHRVIGPDASGYGMILGKTMFNSTRFYSAIATLDLLEAEHKQAHERIITAPLQRLPGERHGLRTGQIRREREKIAMTLGWSNDKLVEELGKDEHLQRLFSEMGPDQNITAYAFNFYVPHMDEWQKTRWVPNQRIDLLNRLNDRVFQILSVTPPERPDQPLIVTSSALDPQTVGERVVREFLRRLKIAPPPDQPLQASVSFLITTVANPWLTDAAGKNGDRVNMIPEVMKVLTQTVRTEIGEIHNDLHLAG
jgi:glutamate/tyrosine decarboxylase-like PLP-dependent enzyme